MPDRAVCLTAGRVCLCVKEERKLFLLSSPCFFSSASISISSRMQLLQSRKRKNSSTLKSSGEARRHLSIESFSTAPPLIISSFHFVAVITTTFQTAAIKNNNNEMKNNESMENVHESETESDCQRRHWRQQSYEKNVSMCCLVFKRGIFLPDGDCCCGWTWKIKFVARKLRCDTRDLGSLKPSDRLDSTTI